MPTGYTYALLEAPDMPFKDFAWTCARAFGAFIEQKDDAMKSPPNLEETASSYHSESAKRSRKELDRLKKLNVQKRLCWAENQLREALDLGYESLVNDLLQNRTINCMLKKVDAWVPPTDDHINLKAFMQEQLKMSISATDTIEWRLTKIEKLRNTTPKQRIEQEFKRLETDIEYSETNYVKEVGSTDNSNDWKKKLIDSIGLPTVKKEEKEEC